MAALRPGLLDARGRDVEGLLHQEGQRQGADHHQSGGGRRTHTGQWATTVLLSDFITYPVKSLSRNS